MDINIPIEKYDSEKNNQVYPNCNKPLKRKIEFIGFIGATCGYDSVGGKVSWQN